VWNPHREVSVNSGRIVSQIGAYEVWKDGRYKRKFVMHQDAEKYVRERVLENGRKEDMR